VATIFVNGCFDLLHEGHRQFLMAAKYLGVKRKGQVLPYCVNRLIVAVNSDRYARELKVGKWGGKYPMDDLAHRFLKLAPYVDRIEDFDNEKELYSLIYECLPCIICKGPDYAGRESEVTGSDIAPVLILDTPETDEIREFKRKAYML
jgi:bifunctional ADP-heptose synthase (sugar kinase/adenylyltransferase)